MFELQPERSFSEDMEKRESIPRERRETVRQELMRLLAGRNVPVSALSQEVHRSEKELYDHLQHLQKAGVLVIIPAACGSCGFMFEARTKVKKPGKCPKCKGTYIKEPLFSIKIK
jgi:predicted Zn-ribbon and HTH transcriptional regulator